VTTITLRTMADAFGGVVPAAATLVATPSRIRVDGQDVTFPRELAVMIRAGVPDAPINLAPSGAGWAWYLLLTDLETGQEIRRLVAVPNAPTVEWGDLVDVDPETLDPAAVPEAAWWAVVDGLVVHYYLREDFHLIGVLRDGDELDLGYIRGEKGDIGPAGPVGMTFRGAWSPIVDYVNLDAVVYNGTTWFAVGDPPPGEVPALSSPYWGPMAVQGSQGNQGPSNSLSIGTVTKVAAGGNPTAAITGDSPAQVLALGLVTGDKGSTGDKGDKGDPGDVNAVIYATGLTGEAAAATLARLNAALSQGLAFGGTRRVVLVGDFVINAPLIIPSNTTLDASSATITGGTVTAGNRRNLLENRAASTVQRTLTASMTAGSTVITATAGAFTAADIGRSIIVPGAADVGIGAVQAITGTISAVDTGANTATIEYPALVNVTGVTARVYDRDTNIRVIGGRWNRGPAQTSNGNPWNVHTIVARRVDGLTLEGMQVEVDGGKYAFSIADVTYLSVQSPRLDNKTSDGVHLMGPIAHAVIRDVKGYTRDDSVALTARDWDAYADVQGDITDVLIDGVDTNGAAASFKVIGGRGVKLRRIRARALSGSVACGASIKDDGVGPTDIDEVSIEGMRTDLTGSSRPALEIGVTNGGTLTVINAKYTGPAGAGFARISGSWKSAHFIDVGMIGAVTNAKLFYLEGTCAELVIQNATYRGTDNTSNASFIYATGTANVTLLRIAGAYMELGDTILHLLTGATVPTVLLSDITAAMARRLATFATGSDVTLNNVGGTFATQAIRIEANITAALRGSVVRNGNGWAPRSGAAGSVLNIFNSDWAMDVAGAARVAGGRLYNTNATLSCGVGLVVCDGTTWKNVFSGATY